mgnify:CR=1 FL=1
MNRIKILKFSLILFATSVSLLGARMSLGIEKPNYQSLYKNSEIEIRRYDPYIVAEVEVDGSLEDAGNKGFRPLADYIFGNNIASEKISMTAPVTQQDSSAEEKSEKISMTAPVTQQGNGNKKIVRFMMPSKYTLENLPKPKNPEVKLKQIPGETFAVIQYSGRWTEANYEKHLNKLREEMAKLDLSGLGDPVWARYDPPFMPWFLRTNEIQIPTVWKK